MRLHVMDSMDNEIVAEIDAGVYRNLLATKTGRELADAVVGAYTVVDSDPRRSDLDNTDAFFPYKDVVRELTTAEELLAELD